MNPAPKRDSQLVVRLSADDLDLVDAFADKLDVSRSEGVRQLLRLGLTAIGKVRSQDALLGLLASAKRPPKNR